MNESILFPELNPCPFCGGEVQMDSDQNMVANQKGFSVSCRNEKCLSPVETFVYGTPQAATEAWDKGIVFQSTASVALNEKP